MRGDNAGVHESYSANGDSRVFVKAPRGFWVKQDGNQTANEWVNPLSKLGIIWVQTSIADESEI